MFSPLIPYLQAQPPQAYSLTEVNGMFGASSMTRKIYRDGPKVLIDQTVPPSQAASKGGHLRILYDLAAGRSYTWDLIETARPCSAAITAVNADFGDPFAFSAKMTGEMGRDVKPAGTETVDGIVTKVLEAANPQVKAKVWIEPRSGLIMRLDMAMGSGPYQTRYQIKNYSPSRPPASAFVLPAVCAKAASAPPPITNDQRIAAETGERAENFADAVMPPASPNSCTVLFRIVRSGTLETMRSGFQVALDTTSGAANSPKYSISQAAEGRVLFSGPGIREVTAQLRGGVLRIPNAPPHFNVYTHFLNGGDAFALIYRQCFGPETALVFLMAANRAEPDYWLWVKSGKLAAPAKPLGTSAQTKAPMAASQDSQ